MRSHEAGAVHGQGPVPAWLEVPSDVNGLMTELWPAGTHRRTDGQLQVAGIGVKEIVEQVGTPVYLIDEADFRARARRFRQAFGAAFQPLSGAQASYAAKALSTRGILGWVCEEGLGLDVCTGGELGLALSADFPANRLTFHGNNKSDAELDRALAAGVGRIVLDSIGEIDRLVKAIERRRQSDSHNRTVDVMLRVRVGVEAHTHEYIATAHEDQKFGISLHDGSALEAAQLAVKSPRLNLIGLHSHIGSQIFDSTAYIETIRRLVGLHAQVAQTTGHVMPEIGLGGGFGVAYTTGHDPEPPEIVAGHLANALAQACSDHNLAIPKVSLEPGRAIAAPSGITLYTVGALKRVALSGGYNRLYVAVDGGMSDNVRTALYSADYSATLASRRSTAAPVLARVVGKHCESGDIIVKDEYLPDDIATGDILAVPVTGAYCYSLASNYNQTPRPPIISIRDGRLHTLVRRETEADLAARDCG